MDKTKGVAYEKANKEVVETLNLTADVEAIDDVIHGVSDAKLRLDISMSGTIELSVLEEEKANVLIKKLGIILMKGLFKGINTQNPNIKVVGAVNNLSAYMSDSACFVCPIRSGAGLQNKILEAMAMGLPVVTSKVGFEGLGAVEGLDLLVANNAEDFAKKIISIVKNRDIRNTLSLKARRFIEKNYSWQQEVKHLEQIMKETIDK